MASHYGPSRGWNSSPLARGLHPAQRLEIRYLIDGAATGGLGVFELIVPPGANVPPPHSYTLNEECAYVLEGTLRHAVNADVSDLTPGEWMHTPKGAIVNADAPPEKASLVAVMARYGLVPGARG